ncbi:type II toxin-antitoxin system HipA family toxin [Leptothrix sp. BB-4]
MTRKPVWVWLPGQYEPVRCGEFSLDQGVGRFIYDPTYRARSDAVALDPMNLPFTRSSRGATETRQGGLFGVLRDASPEGFGLALLEQMRGQSLDDVLVRLELAEGDAVGALAVCEDIAPKLAFAAPGSGLLLDTLAALPPERPSSQAARTVKDLAGTSLGGERPKLTVLHRGQLWIAKLQDRGDPPHAPLREFVSMRLARRCGIRTAEVEFLQVGGRELVLVRRFDRSIDDAGRTTRRLYASAHTVLRLDSPTRGERSRSYVAFAHELQRWCGRSAVDVVAMQRELWRRMAFNAICGNGDDHPRNHGVIFQDGQWRLADAFDIAPYTTFSGTLAMAVTRDGNMAATTANMLRDCERFGYPAEEGRRYIEDCRDEIARSWPLEVQACGLPAEDLPVPSMTWLGS